MQHQSNTLASLEKYVAPILIIALLICNAPNSVKAHPRLAEWTVMVFMNGDNNLSNATAGDFFEMARVGSTPDVNIVAQIDRLGTASLDDTWGQTFRFYMAKDVFDLPGDAIAAPVLGEQNMGDGKTLIDFVKWAKATYPAKKFMLIIWDHGQGWRVMLENIRKAAANNISPDANRIYDASTGTSDHSPYKSISNDETNADELYNLEIRDALAELKDEKIDILGFDACLMSMVETAYAFRDVAKVMVGSQELVPNAGWRYDDWLAELIRRPNSSPKELASILVRSYEKVYAPIDKTTTLSAIDLAGSEASAQAIDKLAQVLIAKLGDHRSEIQAARSRSATYAPNDKRFFHVDIIKFCQELQRSTNDQQIRDAAEKVIGTISAQVIANYAGKARTTGFGSNGLCIYFPPDKKSYDNDSVSDGGYEKDNQKYPVEFVTNFRWADFIHAYIK